ncbi:MAG: sugar phosphate isomerase/epimerase family protein, partial [Planctomycetota bacterium]
MDYRLACADFTFPLLRHDQSLQLISMLGFDGVDIGLFEGRSHIQPSDQFTDPTATGAALKKRLDDLGLRCADVFLQCDPDFTVYPINHPDVERRQHARDLFDKTLEYAAAAGADHITTLPGVLFPEQETAEDSWARCAEELAWRIERCATYKIPFGTEAHVGSIAPSPDGARTLVSTVPELKLTLDYTHFTRDGVPDEQIEDLIAHANHFHMRGARKDRLQASFDDNVIDYGRVLDRMLASNYPGYVG